MLFVETAKTPEMKENTGFRNKKCHAVGLFGAGTRPGNALKARERVKDSG